MEHESVAQFPPKPPTAQLIEGIVNGFVADTSPTTLEESGCAVCSQLKRFSELILLETTDCNLELLNVSGVSRQERYCTSDRICDLSGPIIDSHCKHICCDCESSLKRKKIPKNALANGLWLGIVPNELKDLSFAEHMMIARIRHNWCVVRVSSGRAKMIANIIMYSNPTAAVYHRLPPSQKEMTEVLAFVFTGSTQPTEEDYRRTPMLVRREKVTRALEWLKLNHRDYHDLKISRENLASYPLAGIPVGVNFRPANEGASNKIPSATSVHDDGLEDGTEEGLCPFTVHGLTGEEYSKLSIEGLKMRALQHLESEGRSLGIGHDEKPQSMYDNPQAYPQMFPWLFPYGFGGIQQARHKKVLSESEHKKCLLMYHDKRFQTDLYFPIVAFNHEQLKAGTTGSFLLAKRQKFTEISQRLMSLNRQVLKEITDRMSQGEYVRPETDQEKACFEVLDSLDHVGGHIKGSLTSKKYMRNEIWSLTSFLGAPSWFITLSPADNRHPICLYFADTGEKFSPELRSSAEHNRLIASNPVAAARFFDVMVKSFIKNILGVGTVHPGLYGETAGYYGTVEQQGRLTLHLHLLLWVRGALSPQEIRDRLLSSDSVFQNELIAYLEGVHQGEFLTGSMEDVRASVPNQPEISSGGIHSLVSSAPSPLLADQYRDPTQTLPISVPPCCQGKCTDRKCDACLLNQQWWDNYYHTVDDLILKSNVHKCSVSRVNVDSQTGKSKAAVQGPKGCIDRNGNCRARFPRDLHESTTVDTEDGHIMMKKLEAFLNTFTPCLTYLIRSNSDVTSLLSGTSIKAIVSYISDYVTKPTLKTYQIFSSMYDVFERHAPGPLPDRKQQDDNSRRLILKVVNSLSSKMEIGSPMASMYPLGNPDHYTGHTFVPFWWKSYVSTVMRVWSSENGPRSNDSVDIASHTNISTSELDDYATGSDKVFIGCEHGKYVGTSNMDDYRFRPDIYEAVTLYEWIQMSHRRRATKKEIEVLQQGSSSPRRQYFMFKDGHPLRLSHLVRCNTERLKTVVPNIVGGPLPRVDQGDREYYCCTMLTLFQPWRSGHCLKRPLQLWDDAFRIYSFTDHQRRLMRNFNLRYECLDTRDDFHAQMKKNDKPRGPWVDHGDTDDEDDGSHSSHRP